MGQPFLYSHGACVGGAMLEGLFAHHEMSPPRLRSAKAGGRGLLGNRPSRFLVPRLEPPTLLEHNADKLVVLNFAKSSSA
jgi:hypothetical protein